MPRLLLALLTLLPCVQVMTVGPSIDDTIAYLKEKLTNGSTSYVIESHVSCAYPGSTPYSTDGYRRFANYDIVQKGNRYWLVWREFNIQSRTDSGTAPSGGGETFNDISAPIDQITHIELMKDTSFPPFKDKNCQARLVILAPSLLVHFNSSCVKTAFPGPARDTIYSYSKEASIFLQPSEPDLNGKVKRALLHLRDLCIATSKNDPFAH